MGPTVVIATDDPTQDEWIARTFKEHCCGVRIVSSASEALHVCESQPCDVVVSRVVFMAGLNGVELAESLAGRCKAVLLFSAFPDSILRMLPGFPPPNARFYRLPGAETKLIADAFGALGQIVDRPVAGTPGQSLPHPGIWEVDLQTNTVRLSPEYYALFGVAPRADANALEDLHRHVHPDDRGLAGRAFDTAVAEHGNLYRATLRIIQPDGTSRQLLIKGTIEYNAAGKAIYVRGIAMHAGLVQR